MAGGHFCTYFVFQPFPLIMPSLYVVYFYLAFIIAQVSPSIGGISKQLVEGVEISVHHLTILGAEPIFGMPNFIKKAREHLKNNTRHSFFFPVTCMFAPPMRGVK